MKLLAVAVGAEPRLDDILETLLDELAAGKDEKIKLAGRCGLDALLWGTSRTGLRLCLGCAWSCTDFAVSLFKGCSPWPWAKRRRSPPTRWGFSQALEGQCTPSLGFEALSGQAAAILAVEQDLQRREMRYAG